MTGTRDGGVLLVDPDPAERDRLRAELEACGWRVCVAEDGAAAVRLCAERGAEFRAAVVDLQLPGLQGARVLAGLGAVAPSLARFAMSAGLAPYAVAAFRRLTRTPLLSKPVRAEDLEAALAVPAAV
jgi:two-component system capsular synthesis sensor histidine kinase RcsC